MDLAAADLRRHAIDAARIEAWSVREGSAPRLEEVAYDRDGSDLFSRGPYLDAPTW